MPSEAKKKPSRSPKVEMYDNVLRWMVGSRSNPDIEHLVDLSDEYMQCSCEDHKFRKRVCFHIKQAREALCDFIIEEFRENGS